MSYAALGLGDTQTRNVIGAGVSTALFTAGAFDPEPISKAFILAAAALSGPIISLFSGCGQTCVQATQYADQAGAAMKQIADQYWAATVRTKSMQQAALSNFQQIIAALQQACSNPALGAAGQRCISERLVRGGSAPWCPTRTGCDYYTSIVDPIANDTNVVDDTNPVQGVLSSLTGGAAPAWLAGAALLGIGVWLAS